MRILDRYVAKHYFLSLVSCTVTLVVLYVVIDLFTNLEKFWEMKGWLGFIVSHYAFQVPQFLLHLAPVVSLIAAMLLMVRLVRQNELVPMIAAGISVPRLLLPVLVLACGVGATMMAIEEYVLPGLEQEVRASKDLLEGQDRTDHVILRDDLGNVLVASGYDASTRVLDGVVLLQTGEAGGLIQEITAKSVRWVPEDGGGWIASDGVEYVFDQEGKRLAQRRFGADGKRLVTSLQPEGMIRTRSEGDYLTWSELARQVRERPFEGNLKVRLQEKLTFPLFNLILLGLGLPFVLRRDVRNMFIGGGICMVVCAVFFSAYFFLSDLASKGELNPVLAAWLPVVVFGGIAIWLLDSIPT